MFHPVKPLGTMMKMAPVSLITLLMLSCSVFASTASQDGCDQYAAAGRNASVPIKIKLENSYSLKWYKNSVSIFNKKAGKILQGKEGDITSNGSLKLTKLTKDNSGTYTFEVHDQNGSGLVKDNNNVRLCVLDPVQKPKVQMECLDGSTVQFKCIVQGKAHTTLEWFHDKKMVLETKDTLKKTAKELPNEVTCRVSNKASSETSDPVKQNCITVLGLPETVFGLSIWIFVGGGAGIVVVLIIIVIICCVRTRRKKRMRLKDEGEFRLQWAASEEPHQHHPHHHPDHDHHHHQHHNHQQQQPAGHTGPRQNRSKQQRNQQRGRLPEPPTDQPQPSPRRPAQALPVENGEEQPPPLPQPRKKGPRTQM